MPMHCLHVFQLDDGAEVWLRRPLYMSEPLQLWSNGLVNYAIIGHEANPKIAQDSNTNVADVHGRANQLSYYEIQIIFLVKK